MIVRAIPHPGLRYLIAAAAPCLAYASLRLAPSHEQHLAPILLFAVALLTLAYYGAGPSVLALGESLGILHLLHPERSGLWSASDIVCVVLTLCASFVAFYVVAHRLLEARRQLATLLKAFTQTPAPIILRDSFGSIILWSRGAEALYGYNAHEAEGRFCNSLLRAELHDGKSLMQRQTMASGEWNGALIHHARDGRRLNIYSRWVNVEHDGEQLILQFDSDAGRAAEADRLLASAREELATIKLENHMLRSQLEQQRREPPSATPPPASAQAEEVVVLPIEIAGAPAPLQEHERSLCGEALVVDDEVALRKSICRFLEREGMLVHEAGSYEEALRQLDIHGEHLSLLLTDLVLPGKNGRMIAEEAERRHPGLRIIFTSGYSPEVISRYGVFESGRQLLQKPFTRERLIRAVRSSLQLGESPAPPPDFTSGSIPANL